MESSLDHSRDGSSGSKSILSGTWRNSHMKGWITPANNFLRLCLLFLCKGSKGSLRLLLDVGNVTSVDVVLHAGEGINQSNSITADQITRPGPGFSKGG